MIERRKENKQVWNERRKTTLSYTTTTNDNNDSGSSLLTGLAIAETIGLFDSPSTSSFDTPSCDPTPSSDFGGFDGGSSGGGGASSSW